MCSPNTIELCFFECQIYWVATATSAIFALSIAQVHVLCTLNYSMHIKNSSKFKQAFTDFVQDVSQRYGIT